MRHELHPDGLGVGGGKRRLEKPVRRDRELQLAELVEGNAVEISACQRYGRIVANVPGVGSADNRRDSLIGHRHAPEGREVTLPARIVFARPLGVEVDGAGIVGHFVLRPADVHGELLSDQRRRAGARILDRLEVLAAHRLERCLERRAGVHLLSGGGANRKSECRYQYQKPSRHSLLLNPDSRAHS